MDYFLKKRFSAWLVIFLLVVNIAAISTILFHIYSGDPSPATVEISETGNILFNQLGLDADQKESYQTLNREYNQQSQKILDALTEKRSEMLAELTEEIPDTAILNAIAFDIGKLHTNLKRLTIQNFIGLKKICTPEQQQQLSKMYYDMLECEGHYKGYGRQYRNRYRHGQGGGRGAQKFN